MINKIVFFYVIALQLCCMFAFDPKGNCRISKGSGLLSIAKAMFCDLCENTLLIFCHIQSHTCDGSQASRNVALLAWFALFNYFAWTHSVHEMQ